LICGIFNFFWGKSFVIKSNQNNMILPGKLVLVLAILCSVKGRESLNSDLDISSTLAQDTRVFGQERY
jgi:hypothetical protein